MSAPSSPNWPRRSPFITPDWRWQRVCQIVERGGYATRKRDGELIQQAVRCLRRINQAGSERSLGLVKRDFPDVYMAIKLEEYFSTAIWEIKARVLAGQSVRTIARALEQPTSVIDVYLKLFFDVTSRLTAKTWIRFVVLGMQHDGPANFETLLLWSAWRYGPAAIDPLLDYRRHVGESHDLNTEVGRQRAAIECSFLIHQLPSTREVDERLWKNWLYIDQKFSKTAESGPIGRVFARNVARIWHEIRQTTTPEATEQTQESSVSSPGMAQKHQAEKAA